MSPAHAELQKPSGASRTVVAPRHRLFRGEAHLPLPQTAGLHRHEVRCSGGDPRPDLPRHRGPVPRRIPARGELERVHSPCQRLLREAGSNRGIRCDASHARRCRARQEQDSSTADLREVGAWAGSGGLRAGQRRAAVPGQVVKPPSAPRDQLGCGDAVAEPSSRMFGGGVGGERSEVVWWC